MTAIDAIRIIEVEIVDLRVPTSDTLLGSDPFHKNPNYSAVLTTLKTDAGTKGISVCFTAGAGNDWIAYGAYPHRLSVERPGGIGGRPLVA